MKKKVLISSLLILVHLVFVREPLDQLVLLEARDPQACKVCQEREDPGVSPEPKETE